MKDRIANLPTPVLLVVPILGIAYDAFMGNVAWTIFWGVVIVCEVVLHACDRIVAEIQRGQRSVNGARTGRRPA